MVHADIELINAGDLEMVRRFIIDKDEVRRSWINMLVDTGCYVLCINEPIREMLGLQVVDQKTATLANGQIVERDVAGPIEVRFGNRRCVTDAMVLPGDSEPLLGAIPMEALDVLVDPKRQELVVNPAHPDQVVYKLVSIRPYRGN